MDVRLLVPYVDSLTNIDLRLIRLAEFLGIACDTVAVTAMNTAPGLLQGSLSDSCSCLVVNPRVIEAWIGPGRIPEDVVAALLSRFPHLLVHGLRADAFSSEVVAAFSQGRLSSVEHIGDTPLQYGIASDSEWISDAFSGLSFGPANPANDHVLRAEDGASEVLPLISIGDRPFMAAVKLDGADLLFIASEDVADIDAEIGDAPLVEYFSRLLPHAMVLRHAAGDQCWRPTARHASISIDDPLLQSTYGFLNFRYLLGLAKQHNFHATIAFVPHNFKRSSRGTVRLFQEYPERLSLCFHGNDHTREEFASTDLPLLNTLIEVAESRMLAHRQLTGLPCDKVMVFPQGSFSRPAMKALKSHNFYAAVNTTRSAAEQPSRLTLAELAQPAVLRHERFPVLIRKPIRQIQIQDIAFNLFFGRPVLVGEHHDIFEHPECLIELVAAINRLAPQIRWSNLGTVAKNSFLTRRAEDGTHHVRAYTGTITLANDSDCSQCFASEWIAWRDREALDKVLVDGNPCSEYTFTDSGLRLALTLPPHSAQTISVIHRSPSPGLRTLGVCGHAHAFLRRRLSEFRDNYLSKNRHLLTTAKALQQRFLKL